MAFSGRFSLTFKETYVHYVIMVVPRFVAYKACRPEQRLFRDEPLATGSENVETIVAPELDAAATLRADAAWRILGGPVRFCAVRVRLFRGRRRPLSAASFRVRMTAVTLDDAG